MSVDSSTIDASAAFAAVIDTVAEFRVSWEEWEHDFRELLEEIAQLEKNGPPAADVAAEGNSRPVEQIELLNAALQEHREEIIERQRQLSGEVREIRARTDQQLMLLAKWIQSGPPTSSRRKRGVRAAMPRSSGRRRDDVLQQVHDLRAAVRPAEPNEPSDSSGPCRCRGEKPGQAS